MADAAPPSTEPPPLVEAVRRGTRWVLAAQFASQIVSVIVLAILYRLVAVEEYGLLAAALPAVMLPRMAATLGLSTAVLQQREITHRQLSSLFWYTALLGLIASAMTAACGPILATLYDQPALTLLCAALAGSNLVAALGNQHLALLDRELKQAEASAARLIGLASGGVAGILAARRGAGVWALVAQHYAELAVLAVWAWMLEPWRPGWPGRAREIRSLAAFSGLYSLAQLAGYLGQNIDKVVIPLLLGPGSERALGLYSQAAALVMKPVYVLTAPLTGVMVSGLAQARADGPTHAALAARFFRLVAVPLFPCALGLAAVAPDAMRVLGGPRWAAAGPILMLLAPAMIVYGYNNLATHLLSSAGRAGRLLAGMILLAALLCLAAVAGLALGRGSFLGLARGDTAAAAVLGVAAATSAALAAVWFYPYLRFCLAVADLRPADVLQALIPSAAASLIMAVSVVALGRIPALGTWPAGARLALLVGAGVIVYGVLARREVAWYWTEVVRARRGSAA